MGIVRSVRNFWSLLFYLKTKFLEAPTKWQLRNEKDENSRVNLTEMELHKTVYRE